MFQDLLPFLKEPYIAIMVMTQWLALGVFYLIDQSLDVVLLLTVTMVTSLIMIMRLASQRK